MHSRNLERLADEVEPPLEVLDSRVMLSLAACVVIGHATAPSPAMKSRRLIFIPAMLLYEPVANLVEKEASSASRTFDVGDFVRFWPMAVACLFRLAAA